MGSVFSVSVSSSFDPVLSRFLDCTIRRAKHVRELKDNLKALETELQQLIQTKNDVTRRVRVDEQNQMKRMDRVQGWLQEVQDAEAEVDELLQLKSQQTDKLCLGGYCSKNCKSSYEYGKQVAEKLKDVADLRREGAAFQQVAERVPDDVADEIPLESTILGLESTFDKVWKCLVGEEVGIIGIYGTGGIGKTTLLKQINNKFCNELQSFDVVIWVVVSRVPDFEKIQEDIGEKIGLKGESWKTRSLQKKAGDIFKILSSKKFVLFLDDIWSRINLTDVGVPIPNSKSVSKVVFTTRSFEVCGSMKADKHFKVEYLRDEEAWKLFEENLQSEVLDHPDIPQLAKVVAKECGGLPLALLTVSRAMSCKNTPQEWRHAANLLRNSASQFAEDFPISKQQLIDCWIGEGFLDDSNRSEVYDEGYYNIGILVHACLLEEEKDKEDDKGDYFVKLHDVIRDMLLWIANDIEKEKENYLVEAATGLTQAPVIGKWVGVR
ncbi:probable disease resistance protein At5g63020 [Pistacia vera]|uniref:probable disease resistance protein At5g63020 n=1 Tax=Pistacia vera TaxID=55513 RepID=UPI0012634442|nr:probable disease resistance protein At5g63020 [Pistacia vera]